MAKKKSAKLADTAVETIRHKDKRKNIPTEELRDLYRDEPGKMLYPRDPSLDPQLVWKGKDEQDRQPLEVPLLPIYIQEKIHPQAIIEDLRERHAKPDTQQQFDFFGDFNGLTPLQKIDFYRYDAHWTNRMILGDSLAVMSSLAEKEGLKGQVQMIYLDPPYGIKFGSNWQVSTRKRDVKDGKIEDATRQPEQVRAFRDTWALGIHSYLAYLRDRLIVVRDLLSESGSVFVQIGDENVHLVRSVLDEVFGSECHVVTITVKKKGSQKSGFIDPVNDYLLWYSKTARDADDPRGIKFRPLFEEREIDAETVGEFRGVMTPDGLEYPIASVPLPDGKTHDYREQPKQLFDQLPGARLFRPWPITNGGERKNQSVPFEFRGRSFDPPTGRCWSHTARSDDGSTPGMMRVLWAERLVASGKALDFLRYLNDFSFKVVSNWWDGLGGASNPIYVVQTNPEIVKRCILMTTDPGDLVLDPTCGSGTTAYVAEQWGRRWITCDTSRVALALARTRLMAARYPYYLLTDSPEGVAKESELTGRVPPPYRTDDDIKKGFVYRREPKITSGVIANNEEIDAIHARWQEELEPLRAELNKLVKQKWEDWEIPRQPADDWPTAAKKKLAAWWDKRSERQREIDDSISRAADQELLYDQPYESNKRLRVTGPFTVESLSPHRRLTVQDKKELAEKPVGGWRVIGPDKFGTAIIDNLRKAGIQTRERRERLTFDNLQPFAGEWIHATGEFTDADGKQKRVAVCIGPEHGTVGPELVKEAAKEASRGLGYDLLYVCGFAFDPHVDEEAKRYGNLNVQICRMNPDLSMGDELLKKTGAGNLFMVFGEPDIAIKRAKARKGEPEQFVVQIHGVDVYDPTTGEIRNNSTDDIACWFIDTDYDEDSFFVRHAYFTGADQPYEKLKRALRADIDEAAWSAL